MYHVKTYIYNKQTFTIETLILVLFKNNYIILLPVISKEEDPALVIMLFKGVWKTADSKRFKLLFPNEIFV